MKRGTEKAIESSQTAFFVRRFAYQTLYIRDVAWKFPLFPTNDIFYSNSDPWQICYCHQTREEKDMYSCKYKTQKEMVDNKTVFFVKMKTKIFWGIFLGFFTTFPHFLLRLAHWLLAISNQLQRWMTSAAFQRLSMTQRKTLPKALLKFITDIQIIFFFTHTLLKVQFVSKK